MVLGFSLIYPDVGPMRSSYGFEYDVSAFGTQMFVVSGIVYGGYWLLTKKLRKEKQPI